MIRSVKNKSTYTILLLLCVIGFWLFDNFYTPDTYSVTSSGENRTEITDWYLPSSTTGEIVNHEHYSFSYNEPFEQAEWVAYMLKKEHLTYDDRKRPYFIEDPYVKTKSADWRNYKGSGYDRGHLCPAGDRRFSKQAYNETFYTSNISPQNRDFNAGVWNRLEQKIRQWAKKYDTIFIATGGVLEDGLPEIGDEDVAVPKYYYKIVARGDQNNLKVIAFLMPGKESSKPLQNFAVPVDQIEKMTGIDFFEKLPNDIEIKLESKVDTSDWKF
ncbi:DNA/RNA non-specific endonuclease [Aurantibacter crassamenti]|uniref:DNA/RNA non-specific endonuclease n=1 Tax=Aurantibacter crassamenti TaxID=1837375 RepID=UPI00193A31A8|nr:DNA/RNA non-specific endonuclease [Aurantibacter crassamenti]MBM1104682.1 DNA/RNA non-specific endonuclease [Aurantibacter crassamenti]